MPAPPLTAKLQAGASIGLWLLVIACGRLIAYPVIGAGSPLVSGLETGWEADCGHWLKRPIIGRLG